MPARRAIAEILVRAGRHQAGFVADLNLDPAVLGQEGDRGALGDAARLELGQGDLDPRIQPLEHPVVSQEEAALGRVALVDKGLPAIGHRS